MIDYESAIAEIGELSATRVAGAVASLGEGAYRISGLGALARVGDGVRVETAGGASIAGEVVAQERVAGEVQAVAMAFGPLAGAGVGDRVWLEPHPEPRPCDGWLGRTLDAFGRPVAGGAAPKGPRAAALRAAPPAAMRRRAIGARLSSGHGALDTLLPICRGQRLGVFAGSGVGKSRLMGALAQRMSADVVVIGLIGERGREVRDFVDRVLGPEAMRRAVVIAATSDQPAAVKRRAAWLTMATAEHFRDQGRHVLLLLDSLTRLADAHREVALTGGEAASMNGYPPSTLNVIAGLAERAGPGVDDAGPGAPVCGDVTAVFTVLVAGSDMEEPVADMTRGILDGHVVLSREIAERGRFPAIDVRRSVSRALPDCADAEENALITRARRLLGVYEQAAPMIQIGLYKEGSDPEIDEAVRLWPALDAFFATAQPDPESAFQTLAEVLETGWRAAPEAAA